MQWPALPHLQDYAHANGEDWESAYMSARPECRMVRVKNVDAESVVFSAPADRPSAKVVSGAVKIRVMAE